MTVSEIAQRSALFIANTLDGWGVKATHVPEVHTIGHKVDGRVLTQRHVDWGGDPAWLEEALKSLLGNVINPDSIRSRGILFADLDVPKGCETGVAAYRGVSVRAIKGNLMGGVTSHRIDVLFG